MRGGRWMENAREDLRVEKRAARRYLRERVRKEEKGTRTLGRGRKATSEIGSA